MGSVASASTRLLSDRIIDSCARRDDGHGAAGPPARCASAAAHGLLGAAAIVREQQLRAMYARQDRNPRCRSLYVPKLSTREADA